jgi:patatin-like phospholipase/acyl hydrolase
LPHDETPSALPTSAIQHLNLHTMPGSDLRLLALDGGGVRGLSALMILRQLMEAVDPDAPPKPCDYFDMIGGTSTGG